MPPINGDSMSENRIVIVITIRIIIIITLIVVIIIVIVIIIVLITIVIIIDPSLRMPPDHALASFRQIQHGVSCATSFIFAS